jgi:hypothetical protein
MTWLKPGGYRKFVLIVSEYIVQFTVAGITLVPVKNSSIDQKTLLAVTNAAARPYDYLRLRRLDRSTPLLITFVDGVLDNFRQVAWWQY